MLRFQKTIVNELTDPSTDTDGLVILARGLGLRTIVSQFLKTFTAPHLILVINADESTESALAEELNMHVVRYEMPAAARAKLYDTGGIVSVTSRILVVDMLTHVLPIGKVTGLVVLRAENVKATSLEAFIVRIFRPANKTGFLKAFSDQPERFASGFSPLQDVLSQLKLRRVHIWPRFHVDVEDDLKKRKADVIELYQPLTDAMRDIQASLWQCMEATLSEIKRNHSYLDVDDLTVENALFSSFDQLVRRQLDTVWHKVGPVTRKLVADMAVLRSLNTYVLSYDCVSFLRLLETILSSQPTSNKSPWLFTTAADALFRVARNRVYLRSNSAAIKVKPEEDFYRDLDDEQSQGLVGPTADEEEALYLLESGAAAPSRPKRPTTRWPGITPILETQPKWELLREVLDEIEGMDATEKTTLVMCDGLDNCRTLGTFLSDTDESFMHSKLDSFFMWKASMGRLHGGGGGSKRGASSAAQSNALVRFGGAGSSAAPGSASTPGTPGTPTHSQALQHKTARFGNHASGGSRQPPNKRRRTRGGMAAGPVAPAPGADVHAQEQEDQDIIEIIEESHITVAAEDRDDTFDAAECADHFGILDPAEIVVVRAYEGDSDDRMLDELHPTFIVIYDPEPEFVRRIETYRARNPGLALRVYFLIYRDSIEEQTYLSAIRREKEAFEKLISERSKMVITHDVAFSGGGGEPRVSSRVGGGVVATEKPPSVVVDVREFRSSLPSLLHAGGFDVIPVTLGIGDYIITPEMCIERKSLTDLISSLNSGRLYQQCQVMTTHYRQPLLLIEFDENKSFSLETYAPLAYTPTGTEMDLRSKLVLLTQSFPRLRTVWSSSPHQTVEIIRDLKEKRAEPDAEQAMALGLTDDDTREGAVQTSLNTVSQDILRSLPGITTNNVRYVMKRVANLQELVQLSLGEIQELVGTEPGRVLHRFINRDATVGE